MKVERLCPPSNTLQLKRRAYLLISPKIHGDSTKLRILIVVDQDEIWLQHRRTGIRIALGSEGDTGEYQFSMSFAVKVEQRTQ